MTARVRGKAKPLMTRLVIPRNYEAGLATPYVLKEDFLWERVIACSSSSTISARPKAIWPLALLTSQMSRELGISEATLHRRRNSYGGMSLQEPKRLKKLPKENACFKEIIVEQTLDTGILKEVSWGVFEPGLEEEGNGPCAEYFHALRAPSLSGRRLIPLYPALDRCIR